VACNRGRDARLCALGIVRGEHHDHVRLVWNAMLGDREAYSMQRMPWILARLACARPNVGARASRLGVLANASAAWKVQVARGYVLSAEKVVPLRRARRPHSAEQDTVTFFRCSNTVTFACPLRANRVQ
jgi:hypothetical protein